MNAHSTTLSIVWVSVIALLIASASFAILDKTRMLTRHPRMSAFICLIVGIVTPWFLNSDVNVALGGSLLVATIFWQFFRFAVRAGWIRDRPRPGSPPTLKRKIVAGSIVAIVLIAGLTWCTYSPS
jgi:hypothetical protein